MPIIDKKISDTEYVGNDISGLSNTPSADGISAVTLKMRFDALVKLVLIPKYNSFIDMLANIAAGLSGARQIGYESTPRVPQVTVYGAVEQAFDTTDALNIAKVDKVAGKSLLLDTEIARLATILSTISGGGSNGRIYYPHNSVASDLPGYKVASNAPSAGATSNVLIVCSTQNAYVLGEEFATAIGEPNTTLLPAGTAIRFLFASITGGTAQVKMDLFQYRTTGLIATTGAVALTYADNGALADTITRATGSFITDGFTAGCKITVAGTVSNNGTFTVQTVEALKLTLILSDVLTASAASSTITTKERLLRTSNSPEFTNSTSQLIQFFYSDAASYALALDDRIIFKWWGRRTNAGGVQTITIGTEGKTSTSYIQTTLPVDLGMAQGVSLNLTGLTASQLLGTDATKNLVSLPVATYPSLAELAHVKGVTSPMQTQLDGKVDKTQTVNTKALSGNIVVNAVDIPNTPAGGISALNVQTALNELDTAKSPKDSPTFTGTVLVERNVADALPPLITNQKNASSTGNIHEYKFNDILVGFVDKFGTPAGGSEQTVTNKNKYYPLLKDILGNVIVRRLTNYWNGSAYVVDYSNGLGYLALQNNTGASSNGFGYLALQNNTGSNSNGFGTLALQNNTGSNSNGFGAYALQNNTGVNSNGFGYFALQNNTGASSNGFGYFALQNNIGASSNGFGYLALRYNQKNGSTVMGDNAYGSTFLDNVTGNKIAASTAVDVALDRITLTSHGFGATNAYVNIKYASTDGTAIGGLAVAAIYQIKIIDANTIEFLTAARGTNLTSQGTGNHTFIPQFAYANTSCFGANTQPNKDNQVVLGDANVDTVKMGGTTRTPASATAVGIKGEFCWDASYIYVCVATNSWERTALTTW